MDLEWVVIKVPVGLIARCLNASVHIVYGFAPTLHHLCPFCFSEVPFISLMVVLICTEIML